MSKQPFIPLFFGDLLAATPTWEGEQRALYVILLAYQWTAGPLPSDPKLIAKMCQYDQKTFAKLWTVVGKKFVATDDGLVNLRLEEHRSKATEVSNKRSVAGTHGAAKRWQKAKQEDDKTIAIATALPSHPSHPIPDSVLRTADASPDPLDPRKQIFDLGKTLLGANSGGLIAKAIARTSEPRVAAVLGEMAVRTTADPRSYFAKATTPESPEQREFVA